MSDLVFDAAEYMEALTPPKFRAPNGKMFTGRVVSFQECMDIVSRHKAASEGGESDPRKVVRYFRDMIDMIFPRPWWKFWERRCSHYILQMPLDGIQKTIQTFTNSQGIETTVKDGPPLRESDDTESES